MAECKQCGKEYKAKRSTSAYCGPKCKQDFYRNRMKPVTVTSETLKSKSVTVTNAKPVTVTEHKCFTIDDQAKSIKTMATLHSKRGKDITCFADLPPDVQESINSRSVSPEVKSKLTVNAIKYQHQFPDRYHSTGVV